MVKVKALASLFTPVLVALAVAASLTACSGSATRPGMKYARDGLKERVESTSKKWHPLCECEVTLTVWTYDESQGVGR